MSDEDDYNDESFYSDVDEADERSRTLASSGGHHSPPPRPRPAEYPSPFEGHTQQHQPNSPSFNLSATSSRMLSRREISHALGDLSYNTDSETEEQEKQRFFSNLEKVTSDSVSSNSNNGSPPSSHRRSHSPVARALTSELERAGSNVEEEEHDTTGDSERDRQELRNERARRRETTGAARNLRTASIERTVGQSVSSLLNTPQVRDPQSIAAPHPNGEGRRAIIARKQPRDVKFSPYRSPHRPSRSPARTEGNSAFSPSPRRFYNNNNNNAEDSAPAINTERAVIAVTTTTTTTAAAVRDPSPLSFNVQTRSPRPIVTTNAAFSPPRVVATNNNTRFNNPPSRQQTPSRPRVDAATAHLSAAELLKMLDAQREEFEAARLRMISDHSLALANAQDEVQMLRKKLDKFEASNPVKRVAAGGHLGDVSEAEIKRIEDEIRQQDRLIEGYQKENERLVTSSKEAAAAADARERQLILEQQKLSSRVAALEQELSLRRAPTDGSTLALQLQIAQMGEEHAEEIRLLHARELELRHEIDRLRKGKKELEGQMAGVNVEQMQQDSLVIVKLEADLRTAHAEFAKQIAERDERLRWYAENQQLLDANDALIEQQKARIAQLEQKLSEAATTTKDGVKTNAKKETTVDGPSKLTADAKKIRELKKKVSELESALKQRDKEGPDSLSQLIKAAQPSMEESENIRLLEKEVNRLQRALEEKEMECEKKLRVVRQEFEATRITYERRIKSLQEKLHSKDKDMPRPMTKRETEKKMDELRTFYQTKIKNLEQKLKIASEGGAVVAAASSNNKRISSSPPLPLPQEATVEEGGDDARRNENDENRPVAALDSNIQKNDENALLKTQIPSTPAKFESLGSRPAPPSPPGANAGLAAKFEQLQRELQKQTTPSPPPPMWPASTSLPMAYYPYPQAPPPPLYDASWLHARLGAAEKIAADARKLMDVESQASAVVAEGATEMIAQAHRRAAEAIQNISSFYETELAQLRSNTGTNNNRMTTTTPPHISSKSRAETPVAPPRSEATEAAELKERLLRIESVLLQQQQQQQQNNNNNHYSSPSNEQASRPSATQEQREEMTRLEAKLAELEERNRQRTLQLQRSKASEAQLGSKTKQLMSQRKLAKQRLEGFQSQLDELTAAVSMLREHRP